MSDATRPADPSGHAACLRVRSAGRELLFRQADVLAVALISPIERARWRAAGAPGIRFADEPCPLFALGAELEPCRDIDERQGVALVFAGRAGRFALAVEAARFYRLDAAAQALDLPPAMRGADAPLSAAVVVGDDLMFLVSAPAVVERCARAIEAAA